MITDYEDLTVQFNSNSGIAVWDISSYNFVVAHIITNSATVSFKASNDSDAVQGVSIGGSVAAINFVAIEGTNLSSATTATSIAPTSAPGTLFRFDVVGRYLQFSGGGTVGKLILQLSKIK